MQSTWLLGATLALLGAERGLEIALDRSHARRLRERGAVWTRPDGLGMLVLVQVLLFGGLILEGLFAPWTGEFSWTWPLLFVAVLLQGLRYWAVRTLGWRWSVRVVTIPGAARISTGPYRFFPHPNYLVVALETVVIPLAFGAWTTLVVAFPVCLIALRRRIRVEESALPAFE